MPKFFTQKLILNCVTAGSRYNVTVTNLTGVTELPEGLSIRLSKELSKGLSDTAATIYKLIYADNYITRGGSLGSVLLIIFSHCLQLLSHGKDTILFSNFKI